MNIILYSTGCPKCNVMKKKLDNAGISYIVNSNVDDMQKLGITQVPVLSVNGDLKPFKEANEWLNLQS